MFPLMAGLPYAKGIACRTYLTREAHGYIYIWWEILVRTTPSSCLKKWMRFSTSDYQAIGMPIFACHRNQLDVFHLLRPATTIGRGEKTIADGRSLS